MENHTHHQEALQSVKERIKDIRVAIMTTVSTDGRLHSRPMATNDMDSDGTLWFFTNESSAKVDEINRKHVVSLSYSDLEDNTYVCLSGEAELVTDRQKMEELFNPMVRAWFPKGLEDPDLALLKVSSQEAEYWDSSSSKMVTAFNVLKALVTGTEYKEGEHGKVKL
ncbi:MAG: pyridoxamine 5'-phosphate oxidase family protein [Cytophagaceae bacterium]|nr:pyridoxamine 5'-phosphate oxidase family protein [Cytophagaceae bacterium]